MDPQLLRYIGFQLVEINKIPSYLDNPDFRLIRIIRSGGSGSFTNKISRNGRFIPMSDQQMLELLENTIRFHNIVTRIAEDYYRPEMALIFQRRFTVYRTVRIPSDTLRNINIVQPIPMSCTWSYDFALEWLKESRCCIYVISVPYYADFLTQADPQLGLEITEWYNEFGKYRLLNQPQYEITLGACILAFQHTETINGVVHIYYNLQTVQSIDEINNNFNYVIREGIYLE